jgi:aminotransferase
MSLECDRVGGINLSQGICDLALPDPVRTGAQRAIDAGLNHYTRFDGIPELREAIARKARSFNGIDADPGRHITVSCGATGAFYCACLALLEPGDEVILFEPCYGYHVTTLLAAGAVPRYVPLSSPGWGFDPAEFARAVTSRTRGVMINSPANPSGKVFSREEILQIGETCERWSPAHAA